MNAPQVEPRPVEEMRLRVTRYAIFCETPNGRSIIGYTARPNRTKFLKLAQANRDALLPFVTEQDPVSYSRADGLRLGSVWIFVNGTTERDVRREMRSGATD